MSSANELRAVALSEFSAAGYAATSIHRIADLAGLSKSSVLYHFESKEALLEAAIAPAIDKIETIMAELEAGPLTGEAREAFLIRFTDFLLDHRLEVHMFINQGPSLVDVPVIDRANDVIRRLAAYFASNTDSPVDKMRFGIALGGAAYMLCMQQSLDLELEPQPIDETRAALVTIMTELLAPVATRATN